MLEVTVNINREVMIAQLHAVRTRPKTKVVKDGTVCTYNVVLNNHVVDTMKGTYGCGIDLGIKLLELYKEKEKIISGSNSTFKSAMSKTLSQPITLAGILVF